MQFLINTIISALIVAGTVELANRSTILSALLVSLPLTSILALSLLYLKTGDVAKVSEMSNGIFWLVIPSLGLFLLLPFLLKNGINFWFSMGASCMILAVSYFGYAWLLRKYGIL